MRKKDLILQSSKKKYFFKKANQLASPGVSFICVNFQFFTRLITYHFAR